MQEQEWDIQRRDGTLIQYKVPPTKFLTEQVQLSGREGFQNLHFLQRVQNAKAYAQIRAILTSVYWVNPTLNRQESPLQGPPTIISTEVISLNITQYLHKVMNAYPEAMRQRLSRSSWRSNWRVIRPRTQEIGVVRTCGIQWEPQCQR